MLTVSKDEVFKTLVSIKKEFSEIYVLIETKRLLIRLYKDEDFEKCVQLYGDEKITKFFDHGKPRNREEVSLLIDKKAKNFLDNGYPFGLFSIFLKENEEFIGQIDLIPLNQGVAEVGFILKEEFQNQGLATESLKAIINEYIKEINKNPLAKCDALPINKIIATAHPQNIASNKLLKKVGMSFEKNENRFDQPRLWYYYFPSF